MNTSAVSLTSVRYAWSKSQPPLLAIDSLHLAAGERVFVYGPSGAGKSTLLNLITGVISPQSGSIQLLGTELSKLSSRQRDQFRARHIGVVFQQFNLIPYLNSIDNLRMRIEFLAPEQQQKAKQQIPELLARLGIAELAKQPAYQLSVGQQQRVALARALLGSPDIIVADEPTSSLDANLRDEFMCLLFELLDEKTCLLFVSHDQQLRSRFDREIDLLAFTCPPSASGVQEQQP